jgi:hypothetical protein
MYKAQANEGTMYNMMSHFRRLPNGTIVYSAGGRLYIAQDRRMSNGQMMSTLLLGRDLSFGARGG